MSLQPVDARVDVPVEIEFWPERLPADARHSRSPPATALEWPEPIVDGRIDLGAVAYETLATSLDPYPRREGVSFDWSRTECQEGREAKSGPFAALAALKRRESST